MTAIAESTTNIRGSLDALVATSTDLLRTISEVLDVRTVFPRLSEIANRILPHDALAMGLVDRGGQLVIEAATAELRDLEPHALEMLFREDVIIGDLTAEELPMGRGEARLGLQTFVPPIGQRRQCGIKRRAQGREIERQRIVEVTVLAAAEAVPCHHYP